MCNLGTAVELSGIKTGIAQGTENTMLKNIKNLMETMHLTVNQAMDALEIPKSDQAQYAAKLDALN